MPEGCLHDQWDLDESIALLLSTGNPSPPEKFSGPADLVRYLNFNEFRAAIAIDAPTLEIDADGRPVLLEFFSFARVRMHSNSTEAFHTAIGLADIL